MSQIYDKFKEINGPNPISKQEGNMSNLLYSGLFDSIKTPYFNKYYDFDFGAFVFVNKGRQGSIYFNNEKYTKITTETWKRYLTSNEPSQIPELQNSKKYESLIDEIYNSNHPKFLKDLQSKQLIECLNSLKDQFSDFLTSDLFCESLDEAMVFELYNQINLDKDKFKDFLEYSFLQIMESFNIRYDIIIRQQSKKQNWYDLQWCFTNYFECATLENLPSIVQEYLTTSSHPKFATGKVYQNQIKQNHYKLKLDRDSGRLFDFICLCIYRRDARRDVINKFFTCISNVTIELFDKLKIPTRLMNLAYLSDFDQGIINNLEAFTQTLNQRISGSAILVHNETLIFQNGDTEALNDLFRRQILDQQTIQPTDHIKGTVASKGNFKGFVKIINNFDQFQNFKKGDILVTSMTRPEFVPIMKLAGAIITDEGGITCHAAIVSRELGIPCIVGTKIATQVLHDGDLVEVDATHGVIKFVKNI
jgi:phosphohistidine swiveling domain-containing protein